ncbi:MAG: FAD/NAD(P)-binding protein [Pseudolysinimonas sp.]
MFVGTGISNTFTLIELLAELERRKAKPATLLLIDKDPDFFKGVPYGDRSGDAGLIISKLADFLPAAHLQPFAEWLEHNRDQAFDRFFALGGEGVETWRNAYWRDVEAGEIGELYLPRYVLGQYFEHIARRAIERAHERNVAVCETLVGEVVGLDPVDHGFTVALRDRDGRENEVRADRVILGLGSAPSKRILGSRPLAVSPGCAVIEDPFDPGIADMLERIRGAARQADGAPGRVLIVGSNAGALDVIFNLMNDRTIAAAIGRIDVLSTSGKLPELFHPQPAGFRPGFVGRALKELGTHESIVADDILDAVRQDIESARRDGFTMTDTFGDISVGFNSLLDRLSPDEKLRVARDTGPRIGALQRKVGQDYWGVVDSLIRDGRLVVTRGRFPADAGHGEDLRAIVNCAGSGPLTDEAAPPLIRQLIERGWVRPTGSGLGMQVNDDLETEAAGLYVIGPMLTGNVVHGDPAWNLEHCGRIAMFARRLAAHLAERAVAELTT